MLQIRTHERSRDEGTKTASSLTGAVLHCPLQPPLWDSQMPLLEGGVAVGRWQHDGHEAHIAVSVLTAEDEYPPEIHTP